MTVSAACAHTTAQTPDPEGGWYDMFRHRLSVRFGAAGWPMYTTDADDLWAAYLAAIPQAERQHYTCSACRHFVERYGALVTIDEHGRTTPAAWADDEDGWHGDAIRVLHDRVRRARVTGVFVTSDKRLGTPVTGEWRHMAVDVPRERRWTSRTKTAGQRAAELREDYGTLCRHLSQTSADDVRTALKLFRDGSLGRPERFEEMAGWALDLIDRRATVRGQARDNIAWRAVATAPAGWAHIGNTVLGTVLEDIRARLSFDQIAAKYKAKMHPLAYQRPQAAPTAVAIKRAEELFATLGLAPALRRRFARVDECPLLWTPKGEDAPRPKGGVFSHLTPKGDRPRAADVEGRPTTITWEKFARTVLPDAREMEYRSDGAIRAFFGGGLPIIYLTTACDPDAPPILQWDRPERRNPVGWYMFVGGVSASEANVRSPWHPICGVTTLPPAWDPERPHGHAGDGAILLLAGAQDRRRGGGHGHTGLFPESLRGDLREVRSVIEAHNRTARPEDGDRDDLAIGVDIRKGGTWDVVVRVRTSLGWSTYRLDRWD